MDTLNELYHDLKNADAVLIMAGAGMSTDALLPDFRGKQGFWKAYPALKGKSFEQIATPSMLKKRPKLFNGFYHHRLALYTNTEPHRGYSDLLELIHRLELDCFVSTTNVDGFFEQSGFDRDRIFEHHGSIYRWQCSFGRCTQPLVPHSETRLLEDITKYPIIPCPTCTRPMRPNMVLFYDFDVDVSVIDQDEYRFMQWFDQQTDAFNKVVVLELGAGTGLPILRAEHDAYLMDNPRWKGWRINLEATTDDLLPNQMEVTGKCGDVLHQLSQIP